MIDGDRGETLTEAVARRLRGVLAERRISGLQFAEITGLGRSTINRRLTGETAINTDEFDIIETRGGISTRYLLTGEGRPYPDGAPSRARTEDLRIRSSDACVELALTA